MACMPQITCKNPSASIFSFAIQALKPYFFVCVIKCVFKCGVETGPWHTEDCVCRCCPRWRDVGKVLEENATEGIISQRWIYHRSFISATKRIFLQTKWYLLSEIHIKWNPFTKRNRFTFKCIFCRMHVNIFHFWRNNLKIKTVEK